MPPSGTPLSSRPPASFLLPVTSTLFLPLRRSPFLHDSLSLIKAIPVGTVYSYSLAQHFLSPNRHLGRTELLQPLPHTGPNVHRFRPVYMLGKPSQLLLSTTASPCSETASHTPLPIFRLFYRFFSFSLFFLHCLSLPNPKESCC